MNLVARKMTLTKELGEAEYEMREAVKAVYAAERHLRRMTGWHEKILQMLEEEDKHG